MTDYQQPNNQPQPGTSFSATKTTIVKSRPGCFSIAMFITGGISLALGALAIFICIIVLNIQSLGDEDVSEPVRFKETFVSGDTYAFNKIAIIPVEGVIHGGDINDAAGEGADAFTIRKMLKQALNDNSVKAVVLWIDSPGGEVTASDYVYHAIKKVRAGNKPVIAAMGSVAASGGYYIAVGCDHIMAHKMTITGSIGVIMMNYKYYDLLQKIGVQSEPYTSGRFKDIGSGSRPSTPQEKAILQQHINQVYNQFVKLIADGRPKLTVKKIKDSQIGDGRIFSGEEALELGLVDSLGYLEDAVSIAAKQANIAECPYQAVSYSKKFSLEQMIFGQSETGKVNSVNLNLPGNTPANNIKLEQGKMYFLPAQ